jgi:uncharacterized protein YndB with AHSA1/START domain
METKVEIEIGAPPTIVYATATDVAQWPQFISGIEQVEILTAGPIQVGTRFRETRIMFGRRASEEMAVAALEPPHRFVLTAENHGTRYVATHEIVSAGAVSRLMLTFEGKPVAMAARLFSIIGLLFMGAVTRKLEADLQQLKAEAERRLRTRAPAAPAGAPPAAG